MNENKKMNNVIECELDIESQRENLLHDLKTVRALLGFGLNNVDEDIIGYAIDSELYNQAYKALIVIESNLFDTLCNLK